MSRQVVNISGSISKELAKSVGLKDLYLAVAFSKVPGSAGKIKPTKNCINTEALALKALEIAPQRMSTKSSAL